MRSTRAIGIELTSAYARRRPLTSSSVRCDPSPRIDTVDAPSPPPLLTDGLVAAPAIATAYVLLPLAALARAFGPSLTEDALLPLVVARTLWLATFILFLAVYAPMLLRSRPDGKPG